MLGTALRCSASGKATGALLLSYRSGVGDDSYRSRYPFFLHLSVKSDGTREIAKGVDHSPQVGNNLWITGHQRARPYWAVVEKASRPSRHRVGSPMESISGAACTYLLRGRSGHAALGSGCSACRKTCEAPGPALSYPSRGWGARGGSVMAAREGAPRGAGLSSRCRHASHDERCSNGSGWGSAPPRLARVDGEHARSTAQADERSLLDASFGFVRPLARETSASGRNGWAMRSRPRRTRRPGAARARCGRARRDSAMRRATVSPRLCGTRWAFGLVCKAQPESEANARESEREPSPRRQRRGSGGLVVVLADRVWLQMSTSGARSEVERPRV
jgi:hypothetical protein